MAGYGWYKSLRENQQKYLVIQDFRTGMLNAILNNFEFLRVSSLYMETGRADEIPFFLGNYKDITLEYKKPVSKADWGVLRKKFFAPLNAYEKDYAERVALERLRVEMERDNNNLERGLKFVLTEAYTRAKANEKWQDPAVVEAFFTEVWESASPHGPIIHFFLYNKKDDLRRLHLPEDVETFFNQVRELLTGRHKELVEFVANALLFKLNTIHNFKNQKANARKQRSRQVH